MQLGIKLFYLLIYEHVDLLFVILFTVEKAMELSVDPSLTFFNSFFLRGFLHLLYYFLLDALCVLLTDRYTLVRVIELSVDPSLFFFSDFCHFFIYRYFIIFAGCTLSYA